MQKASNELERAKRYDESFAVVMMDLDHFKNVNDTYGHAAGDYVISEFGKIMKRIFRNTDYMGRMGGEEFSVLMVRASKEEAFNKAEQFRKYLEEHSIEFQNQKISLTVSIGVTIACQGLCTIDEVLRQADKALYKSKARGRNCTTIYE